MTPKDLTIFIPTLGRSDIQHTYKNLTDELRKITKLVIHKSEKDLYPTYKTIVCPEYEIAKKRSWIIKNCKTKYLIMLDDDLRFHTRKSKTDWHLRYSTEEDVNDMFDDVMTLLESGYAHVGVSPRPGNHTVADDFTENVRMFGFLAYDVETILKNVEFNRVEFQEDFDICLQLLRKGYPNAVLYKYCHGDQLGFHSVGGCVLQRKIDNQNASVKKLHELHPDFVRIKQVNKKSYEGDMATRLEVTVQWKKAYESSQTTKKQHR